MKSRLAETLVVSGLLGCIILFGVALRLQDPLSTKAIGAEDPYTHVVFTKEWIRQGYFADSFHLGTEMYPPGMHAFLAAFVPFTGLSLYDFARLAPAIIAAIGMLGMYVVGARLAGPAAGLGAAFVVAIMPEHIFRSELLFPTAFDLVLLPLWFLGFHLAITTARVEGAVLFVGAAVPFAIMHPWVVPLFAAPLALYAAIRFVRGAIDRQALLLAGGLIVPPIAFAMAFRWSESDTGFADFLAHVPGLGWIANANVMPPVLFVVLLFLLGVAAFVSVTLLTFVPRFPRAVRIGLSIALCVASLAALPLVTRTPPQDVDLQVMFGAVALALGIAGLALAYLRPTALGDMGLAIVALLLPLTAIDLFDSPFWPQRTAAYLSVGVALLGATVAWHAHQLMVGWIRSERAVRVAGPAALVALGLVFAGTSVAAPVNTYEWYRLYNDEHFEGFQQVAQILDHDDSSRVFLYTWQPALMVKTLNEPEHVWFSPKFFTDPAKRAEQLANVNGPAYVLVDKFTLRAEAAGKADTGFLDDDRYELVYQTDDGMLSLYEVRR